ncbi:MAG: glycerate kinase, partial [Candidatus Limnocylindrales bacterium]|nr:glycerate kinase [Candidatus Limnocylindrales bacterium]
MAHTEKHNRTILFAPDSFKGSLTSVQVARALADGWCRARPSDTTLLCPLADGGEGTLEAIAVAGGWVWQTAEVHDPLGRPIEARWLRSVDGTRAVIEMAEASGLSRVAPGERDAVAATSVGSGETIRAALDAGVTSIVLGIGGSATTDGGAGLLRGLGANVDRDKALADVADLDPRLADVDLAVACD